MINRRGFIKGFLGLVAAAALPVGVAMAHIKEDIIPIIAPSSIWMVSWGADKVTGIYPKKTKGHSRYYPGTQPRARMGGP